MDMPDAEPAVELRAIRKVYGATVALDDMSFAVRRGAVHALLGENGAGKSTTVKLLSGLVRPDAGEIRIFGDTCHIRSPREAHRLGIQTAFQEMTQIRDLTVAENMLLLYEPTSTLGRIRRREAGRLVAGHLERLGLSDIDPRREMRDLDLSARQKIDIARAVIRRPRILLLDEPTSTLSGRDIDWLGQLIARLREEGVTIIFISHRMPEVRRFCDELTVLRNGKDIGSSAVAAIGDDEVIRMIIGRSIAATFPPRVSTARAHAPPALAAHQIATERRLRDASFALLPGEVLGIAGLQGMGQLELFLACFGAMRLTSGSIAVNGKPVVLASPADAVRANIGISLVPEDRKTEALFLQLDGQQNVALPTVQRRVRCGLINRRAEAAAVARVLDIVQVQQRALYTRVSAFSGGNQQKIAIAKWLLAESSILLLYDPTRGVDVGTKHEIYMLIREYAKAGGAVLFCSSEVPELVNLCDRVLVMYGGRVVRELAGEAIDEEAVMRAALGEAAPKRPSPVEVR
jgi:ribose transport system ATP-binding protein